MFTEYFRNNSFFTRNLLLKVLLLVGIILILIAVIPMFRGYKQTNKKVNDELRIRQENSGDSMLRSNLNMMKDATLVYFKEDKLPTEKNETRKITLNDLYKNKLLQELKTSDKKSCDINKSYSELTKLDKDYLLRVYIKCGNKSDYMLLNVSNYSYCSNTLCEKDTKKENKNKNKNNNSNKQTIKLSQFGDWSNYERTSCDTKEVVCDSNDTNCLKETKVKLQTEKVGSYTKKYSVTPLEFYREDFENKELCTNYNYVIIQNNLYKTNGNFDEVLNLNRTSTNSWTYKGTVEMPGVPGFDGKTYYKFVSINLNDCDITCDNVTYTYDVYEYNYNLGKALSVNEEKYCVAPTTKLVSKYKMVKVEKSVVREEPLYATACYQSTRERKIVK